LAKVDLSTFLHPRPSLPSLAALRVSLAGPERVRACSWGEVKKAAGLDRRTREPARGGLFCTKIFGPVKGYACGCRTYARKRRLGTACARCGAEVVSPKARRERFGHVELASPVAHAWFSKGASNRIGYVLDLDRAELDRVLDYEAYIVIDPKATSLARGEVLRAEQYRRLLREYGTFTAGTGGEMILALLERVDLHALAASLREAMQSAPSAYRRKRIARRLKVVEALRDGQNRPEWLMITALPVLPPGLRPRKRLASGKAVMSGLNELYRRVVARNNRLKRLRAMKAPEAVLNHERRLLRRAVDALFDRDGHPLLRPDRRGKRVDYSGRAPVVVGPALGLRQCGLPKQMALELFKPFVYRRLKERGHAAGSEAAKALVRRGHPAVWRVLAEVVGGRPVLVHRAPASHRFGVRAFEPVLVEGKAVQLPPLVCADFDGGRVSVHVPLSVQARKEARTLMTSPRNLLSPADGRLVIAPTGDVVLGLYYATRERPFAKGHLPVPPGLAEAAPAASPLACRVRVRATGELVDVTVGPDEWADAARALLAGDFVAGGQAGAGAPEVEDGRALGAFARDVARRGVLAAIKRHQLETFGGLRGFYSDLADVRRAYDAGEADLHAFVAVRHDGGCYTTTVGRCLVGEALPRGAPFGLANQVIDRGAALALIDAVRRLGGDRQAVAFAERLCSLGFDHATRSGTSLCINDLVVPAKKKALLDSAYRKVEQTNDEYQEGLLTDGERYNRNVDVWAGVADEIADEARRAMGFETSGAPENGRGPRRSSCNPVYVMADSGACDAGPPVRHLAAVRGLVATARGDIIETPVTGNLREGLSAVEYFVSSYGARRGLAVAARAAAGARALLRRLVDAARDVAVTTPDCAARDGREAGGRDEGGEPHRPLAERILGRVLLADVVDPLDGATVVVPAGTLIDENDVASIEEAGVDEVAVRSVLSCRAERGVCALCYGRDLARGRLVGVGEAVGVVAAQALGEPFLRPSARPPAAGAAVARAAERASLAARHDGVVRVHGVRIARTREGGTTVTGRDGEIAIIDANGRRRERHRLAYGAALRVADGERVKAGQALADWNPHATPVLAEVAGVVRYKDFVDYVTVRDMIDAATGRVRRAIAGSYLHDLRPQIVVEDEAAREKRETFGVEFGVHHALGAGAFVAAAEGDRVEVGDLLAEVPRGSAEAPNAAEGHARVAALFDARVPERCAVVSEIDGEVSLEEPSFDKPWGTVVAAGRRVWWRTIEFQLVVTPFGADGAPAHDQARRYFIVRDSALRVRPGERVRAGDPLTAGPANPHDVLRAKGERGFAAWLVGEVRRAYGVQGVDVDDRHIEVVVRQMLRWVRVERAHDTPFVDGERVERRAFERENEAASGRGGRPAVAKPALLGLAEAARQGRSFVDRAPGLQETVDVLAEASLGGKRAGLHGVKERALAGRGGPSSASLPGVKARRHSP
jgi:DNA-directed RNA polymerase subunit beta'